MRRQQIAAGLAALLVLAGCDRIPGATPKPASGPAVATPATKGNYAFSVKVQMTPRLLAAMKRQDDHMIVSAFYYGFATPQSGLPADSLHRTRLGFEVYSFAADAVHADIPGTSVDRELVTKVNKGEAWVLVDIQAAAADNIVTDILSCQDYVGSVGAAQAQTPTISCDLADGFS